MRSLLALMLLFIPTCVVSALDILPREGWNAKDGIVSRMQTHRIDEIVIHHTGVRKQSKYSLRQKLKFLQQYSQRDKKWGDVPYHFYIDMHGQIGEGRSLKYSGDTNTRYNPSNKLHIVVEGDLENEKPSKQQIESLKWLVLNQQRNLGLSSSRISGHLDHASTNCPGQHLYPYINQLRTNEGGSCSQIEFHGECFSDRDVFMTAQSFLSSYACYDSAIDGVWGRGSKSALQGFNNRNGTNFSMSSKASKRLLLEELSSRRFQPCSN